MPSDQASLMAFCVKKKSTPKPTAPASFTSNASKSNKNRPKYPLETTRVKKREGTLNLNGDHPLDESANYFVGVLTSFDADEKLYQVQFEHDGRKTIESWKSSEVQWGKGLNEYIGTKIAKYFNEDLYFGQVVDVCRTVMDTEDFEEDTPLLFRVLYDDGDFEDFDNKELNQYKRVLKLSQKKEKKDNSKKRSSTSVSVSESVEPKDSQASDEEPPKSKRKKPTVKEKKTANTSMTCSDESIETDNGAASASATRPRRRRCNKTFSYFESYDVEDGDDDTVDMEMEDLVDTKQIKKKSKKSGTAKKTGKKNRQKTKDSDDDSDFEHLFNAGGESEDEDLDSDVVMTDEEANISEEVFSEEDKPKKSRGRNGGKAKKVENAPSTGKKTISSDAQQELLELVEKGRKAYRENNNPQKLPDKPFVDPVGVDPTHGIVESIIGAQVRKVGGLLEKVMNMEDKDRELGEMVFPIRLQTACSGTDAPSIALGLVQESLDKMSVKKDDKKNSEGRKLNSCHGFTYSHEMSCEIEPFKQAYIGRNFPGVPLFPDITKLTGGTERNERGNELVVDVYGRPQTIPDGNLFVAGTSCKDFSMLKTCYRKDIEDKGTSGETFLAAVEFLEVKQPPIAIFENVDNAPWDKMQEYIRGYIKLENRNEVKNIKDPKKKVDADNDLKFSINEHDEYVAEEIPRQIGIRAGCVVQGFVKGNDDANNVRPLKASSKDNKKLISLGKLAKTHKINLQKDTLVMKKKARYCTHLVRIDTKEYGLPQTRNRRYLFIWRSDDPDDDMGEYFQEILEHLKTPLLYSMDSFLLSPTHDRIRGFREALRSGPGRMVARERSKELDFWDWELSRIKDLALHLAFREKNGLAENSRWLTGWKTRGRKSIAIGLWPELVDMWNMRRCDQIDCYAGAAMRDATSRDPLHHSFTWDISQNVTRAPFRSATVGVSGCVTPGGELIMPHKGRTVMGYEKLLLQGIPFSRLLLGSESEVQLSDLAGNAMSVPVVCATMLAAICAPQLRRERVENREALLANFALSQKYESSNGAVLAKRGDLYGVARDNDVCGFVDVFFSLAKDLAQDAYTSSVLCNCETSGRTSHGEKILECKGCGVSICHSCSGRQQIDSHNLMEIDQQNRIDSCLFERKLRCAAPSILRLGKGWENEIDGFNGLESYTFQLQQVDRKSGHWMLTYGAWEDHGSARQVAEIRVLIGRIGVLSGDVGIVSYIKCFAPAIRHNNPLRGRLQDSAKIIIKVNGDNSNKTEQKWKIQAKNDVCQLNIVGSEPCPSQRVQIGLSDTAYKALAKHKPMKKFIPILTSRNNMLSYDPKWKTWPGTILISGDSSSRVNGTYHKLKCQQTVVLSALWRRDDNEDGSHPLYIYIRPDVIRSGLDTAVISTTPSYRDGMEFCELQDWIPENTLTQSKQKTKVKFLNWDYAPSQLSVEVPKANVTVKSGSDSFNEQVCTNVTDHSGTVLCEMSGLSDGVVQSLLQHCESGQLDLVGKSGTKNAKRLSIVAAPSLMKFAAEGNLPLDPSQWYALPASFNFGLCEKNCPIRPVEKWQKKEGPQKGRKKTLNFTRDYDPEESNDFFHKLQKRPTAFTVNVDKSKGKMFVRMDPLVAGHHAAAYLVRGRDLGDDYAKTLHVDYCLSELSSMGEPSAKEFQVPNSDHYEETHAKGLTLPLYKRQAKALTRMQAIERGEVQFSEEERSEHLLHGIGWCLIARAAKRSRLRGGVLGDAIGSGKTVVTIALILGGVKKARQNRNIKQGRSGATLIVVPPGLVEQWDDERKKFTADELKCIKIQSTKDLKNISLKEICQADIVIVPAGIIEERGTSTTSRPYTENLSQKAGAVSIPPAPSGYSQREAPSIEGTWVRNMASGPGIYVGNNGKQKTRDEQAYYGHCYSEAIQNLRKKSFAEAQRGVPLEYVTWERIVIDECHETLVTSSKQETGAADFRAQARRGAREFLGVSQTDTSSRPLVAAVGVWGLTGTPLLETEARVTELANLMGGTYLTGSAHHWRKEERESGRDLFLNQQEGPKSREYRCAVQEACHAYVAEACQRNRGATLDIQLTKKQYDVNMTPSEGQAFINAVAVCDLNSFTISPDQLGDKASGPLSVTASSKARHAALSSIIENIQMKEPDTKILIFANAVYGGYASALSCLKASGTKFCHVTENNSVSEQNEIISWFRHVDATEEDKSRPRILLLSFDQAAGHNLQEACHNVIIYDPMYSGSDAVADASVEEQAIGRVMRQGQKFDVTVTRIVVQGPKGERCLDNWTVERNLDEDVLRAATSNFE